MANIAALSVPSRPVYNAPRKSLFPALPVPALPLFRSGVPRGGITELTGPRSSGKTAAVLHILAQATARGEVCAVVDACDRFHPASAAAAGVDLARLVWVRCREDAEHAMKAADLLLHAGGFGVVVLDLCDVRPVVLNRIPLSYWYRFRLAIENTPTVLAVCTSHTQTRASLSQLDFAIQRVRWDGCAPFSFLQGAEMEARFRKPLEGRSQRLVLEKTG